MASRILHRGVALALAIGAALVTSQIPLHGQDPFRFRTGIELINVTATVTDSTGLFVSGLKQSDFRVFEDDQPVEITHFSAERVPVSLGIVLDTSGSMSGAKIVAARAALNRFLFDLLGPEDEVFLYRFDNVPRLLEAWTTDRQRISEELRAIQPDGATALYDAVANALPLLRAGHHRKKALLVISDGNDTSSRIELADLKQRIRESEALVYAIGMDAQTMTAPPGGAPLFRLFQRGGRPGRPVPMPFPMPGGRTPPKSPPVPGIPTGPPAPRPTGPPPPDPGNRGARRGDERVNVVALRDITDDSGGRTEILRDPRDLDPATARIADELSKQYYIGYPSRGVHDGRWHAIRVEVNDPALRVRARRGYVSPAS
jgi:Ca-activated chloride channel family protein